MEQLKEQSMYVKVRSGMLEVFKSSNCQPQVALAVMTILIAEVSATLSDDTSRTRSVAVETLNLAFDILEGKEDA
jgi:hypothetical protein